MTARIQHRVHQRAADRVMTEHRADDPLLAGHHVLAVVAGDIARTAGGGQDRAITSAMIPSFRRMVTLKSTPMIKTRMPNIVA